MYSVFVTPSNMMMWMFSFTIVVNTNVSFIKVFDPSLKFEPDPQAEVG